VHIGSRCSMCELSGERHSILCFEFVFFVFVYVSSRNEFIPKDSPWCFCQVAIAVASWSSATKAKRPVSHDPHRNPTANHVESAGIDSTILSRLLLFITYS
jgi:hypothetical protein